MAIDVTILGTSAGAPTRHRNVTSLALQFSQRRDWWMIDCGEATQHRLLTQSHLKVARLSRIFITHAHGDHCFGLPGLLASRALTGGGTEPLDIHGPPEIGAWLQSLADTIGLRLDYELRFHPVQSAGEVIDDRGYVVRAAAAQHWGEAWCYRIDEPLRPGELNIGAVDALGVPAGPQRGALARGESITLPDGTVLDGAGLVGPSRAGGSVVFSGDTMGPNPALIELAAGADLLIHEATYHHDLEALAIDHRHSTTCHAATVAVEASVAHLVITHAQRGTSNPTARSTRRSSPMPVRCSRTPTKLSTVCEFSAEGFKDARCRRNPRLSAMIAPQIDKVNASCHIVLT
jgi:ribonuclease Z